MRFAKILATADPNYKLPCMKTLRDTIIPVMYGEVVSELEQVIFNLKLCLSIFNS
jgi:hypothetical protein